MQLSSKTHGSLKHPAHSRVSKKKFKKKSGFFLWQSYSLTHLSFLHDPFQSQRLLWKSTFLCQTLSMISSVQKVWPWALRQFYCYLYCQVVWTKPQDAEHTSKELTANTFNCCGEQNHSNPRVGRGKDKNRKCD